MSLFGRPEARFGLDEMLKYLRDRPSSSGARRKATLRIAPAIRAAALFGAFLALASCGVASHNPVEPSCEWIGGSYTGTFTNSCGGSGTGPVVVAQNGCAFTALIPGFGGGTIAGQIEGGFATFTMYFTTPCSGSATGTATLGGTYISGTYSGGATGIGCCNPVTGSFVLHR